MQTSSICTIDLKKKQLPILYTVGGVIRTIAVPYMQYFTKND